MNEEITNIDIRRYEKDDYYAVKTLLELTGQYNPITDSKEGLDSKQHIEPDSILIAHNDIAIIGCLLYMSSSDAFIIEKIAPLTPDAYSIRVNLLFHAEIIAQENMHNEILLLLPENHKIPINELLSSSYKQIDSTRWVKEFDIDTLT